MSMSRDEAIEKYNFGPDELYDIPEPEECPECGEQAMFPAGSENDGSDRDGRRGQKLYYFTCAECGFEDSSF